MGNPYLLLYNTVLLAGWAYCLYITVNTVYVEGHATVVVSKELSFKLWKEVQFPLKLVQTAAVLEIVHSAFGVVRSPVMITTMQVVSRLWVLWGIADLAPGSVIRSTGIPMIPNAEKLFGDEAALLVPRLNLTTLLLAWSLTEVIRYAFFAFKELGWVPHALTWLRYSAFLPLYPLGVASELAAVALAWPTLALHRPWSLKMPNVLNFPFDYPTVCLVGVALYLPGLPRLYSYMLAQRRKVLSAARASRKVAVGATPKKDL